MSKNCKIAYHRGGLKECLETEKEISYDALFKLANSGLYKYYAYDERIKCNRYLLIDIDKNYNLPTWLHHYGIKKNVINGE